jgi:hypothetical protein
MLLDTCKSSYQIQLSFQPLAGPFQDTSGFVRDRFYRKLARYLQSRRLDHPRFNVLMYLAAPDPLKEVKDIALKSITSRLNITGPRKSRERIEVLECLAELLSTCGF